MLVFDNCEHLLDAVADLVQAILATSATPRILATSREGLGVADEQLWPVPSLEVGAAVKLFSNALRAWFRAYQLMKPPRWRRSAVASTGYRWP